MVGSKSIARLRGVYEEYPSQFWVLIVGLFIDRLGGALMFPFFTLYVTRKFGVGMTEVGVLFALFSISSLVGSAFGGALTDRLGRKKMLIFGLVVSALTGLLMGIVNRIELFFTVAVFVGLFANAGGPAAQAMVADLLPEKKRAEGFGILRVVANLAVTIGPMIGGLLAARSYLSLFIADAISSTITAVVVAVALEETKPAPSADVPQESMLQTFGGYWRVVQDSAFMLFIVASILMVMVYMQMNSTLPVYLRDVHDISEQRFGYILSLNAGMVVLFQFPITRRLRNLRPLPVMVAGTLLYALGFSMYGVTASYALFLLAMVIITIGEMLVSPVSQALVARLAPDDMRGRYMAMFGFSWAIPAAVGPLLAGVLMDNFDPNWVWYGAGLLGLVAAAGYGLLDRRVGRAMWRSIDARLHILEQLEERCISAAEAAELLEVLEEKQWTTPEREGGSRESRRLRIRVIDPVTGAMKFEESLPMGLVHTVLDTEGRLVDGLDSVDLDRLRELVDEGETKGRVTLETDEDGQIEICIE